MKLIVVLNTYHSVVKQSEPGVLPTFNLEVDKFNSLVETGCTRFQFCELVRMGSSKELRNVSIWVS